MLYFSKLWLNGLPQSRKNIFLYNRFFNRSAAANNLSFIKRFISCIDFGVVYSYFGVIVL